MTEQANEGEALQQAAVYAENLLRYYSFELGGQSLQPLLLHWFNSYPVDWVRLAIVEALYQGRYKAVSVEQLLMLWQRRGQPLPHFNHEFERLVCHKLPRNLAPAIGAAIPPPNLSHRAPERLSFADRRSPAGAAAPRPDLSRSDLPRSNLPRSNNVINLLERLEFLQRQSAPPPDRALPLERLHTIAERLRELPSRVAPVPPPGSTDDGSAIHRFRPEGVAPEFHAKLKAAVPLGDRADAAPPAPGTPEG